VRPLLQVPAMALAIFDLDNTLLGGDSDHAWGEFACEIGIVDPVGFGRRNDKFYQDYLAGALDIDAYLHHALAPLANQDRATAEQWHRQFMAAKIEPMLLPAATQLLNHHRQAGDDLLIITATNRFITEPIAARLGVADLIACDVEIVDGRYTGNPTGLPSYGAGKVTRLQQWLAETGGNLEGSIFYSDSHNDLPLLRAVEQAVAVDPDDKLRAVASAAGWPIISLRD
jgi:HAD superfamily hydrolase (TIGR01490 family)